ncbi:MAG: DUF6399 domain-containing protein [Planctomycetes bacterium]|nr:DUF6399 domain-containing protein [Planctomycetota bacterium]
MRHHSPADDDPVAAFFFSPAGESVLRHIVLAAFATFQLRGACGIRFIGDFLKLSQLDRFVASSRGALHPLAAHIESDLVAFRDCEQPDLAQQMQAKTITLVPDEHFHSGKPCLVGIEPVANFILVECYRDRRDADTWKEAIEEGTKGMPLKIVQMTSDQATALVCCAEKGFEAMHSPDLFHGQRDMLKPVLLPLNRPIQQAQKDLEKATQQSDKLDTPMDEMPSEEQLRSLIESMRQELVIGKRLEQSRQRKEEAVEQVRGVGDDYHPFDRVTGRPVTAEEVGKRLTEHVDRLAEVVEEARLGEKAEQAVNKSRTWVATLMGCVAWFWCLATARVQELELSEEQERIVKEKLLASEYWATAAGRARSAEERKRLKVMAAELTKEAWRKGGALSSLSEEARKEVAKVSRETAGMFQRSSSCVEGRNGRLSLQHHGHSRVSERRLKALTVMHNYMVKRPDGTTAAERFFGQKPKDVFSWLLERMPDLPRPARKRPRQTAESYSKVG